MPERIPHIAALRAFEAAARHLSFQKAAEELGLTPSAVSHQIRSLEDYLDVRLFDRLTRAVALTEAGKQLHPGVRDGFRSIETAVRQVRSTRRQAVITVSAGPSIAAKWLMPRLYTFEEQHPQIEVRLSTTNTVVDLTRDDVDVAIRHGLGRYEDLECTRLFGEAYAPMCAPTLATDPERPIRVPGDLRQHRLLHDDASSYPGPAPGWVEWLQRHDLETAMAGKARRYPQTDHAIQAAIDGAGVLLGRVTIAAPDLAAGRLVRPFDDCLPSEFGYFFVTRPGRTREKPIAAFKQWLLEEAARLRDVPD